MLAATIFTGVAVGAGVLPAAPGTAVEDRSEQTAAKSTPFDSDSWAALPWWTKALAWFSYRFRRYL